MGNGDVLCGSSWCGYVEVDVAYFGVVSNSCLYGGGAADGLFLGCGLWCAYGGWCNIKYRCVVLVLCVDGVIIVVDDAVAVVVKGAFAGFVEVVPVVAGKVGSADDVGARGFGDVPCVSLLAFVHGVDGVVVVVVVVDAVLFGEKVEVGTVVVVVDGVG